MDAVVRELQHEVAQLRAAHYKEVKELKAALAALQQHLRDIDRVVFNPRFRKSKYPVLIQHAVSIINAHGGDPRRVPEPDDIITFEEAVGDSRYQLDVSREAAAHIDDLD
jgi:hypothetical protein